ncbi:MAG TPA: enoyl-CoA hydratase/isomerase family protein [Ottowia sp.]|uniref:enoyl-CoA hydratase/isomerase family protein n=1 Tax=Ottowia sp. TaxID=1898956 RepID=UPI002B7614DA|nr:enoyl-CoA hydratase/isomerase family protein [Ottowia sp.]HNE59507.1 enoyl-CoA hydratase/isomerase family protein [Ottowia sp.]HNI84090.1 enoyl-CoA hydratase/isomerase family protein [Ottowia sp.]HNJ46135.1 enoyl-CoA hydratase/isomerase family protein [Ottowia sp.]HNK52883.1 enoyl-CoA hydratase/isomerase family protein [Ottowia sp.]HNL41900.1 enoyl-CoA hydratase/isomerase family protein [Ottowia sp.]
MSQPELLSRRDGPVLHLQLHRPEVGNALSAALVQALTEAVDAATHDVSVRLLVLSGAGRHFCTGFDLSDLDRETDDSLLARFTRVELLLQAVHAAPFATLALAHGRTMGAGADLFAACGDRWIVGDAGFAFPGAAFGLVLGTVRLTELVGAPHAAAWIEGGQRIDADQALACGLATRHIETEQIDAELGRWGARVNRLDAPTQRAIQAAIAAGRRPRGDAGDAQDLARLVRSAARPGLRDRIAAYRAAQRKG